MEEYLKAGVQTNESEEILFICLQEEVGAGGGGGMGEAEPDLIKEIKWPYTSDSKEQSPWESPILLALIKCTLLLR